MLRQDGAALGIGFEQEELLLRSSKQLEALLLCAGSNLFKTLRGQPAKGIPWGVYTSQINLATVPSLVSHGKTEKVS